MIHSKEEVWASLSCANVDTERYLAIIERTNTVSILALSKKKEWNDSHTA